MSDNPTTTVVASDAWHSWHYTSAPGGPEQVFEFPMPLPEIDAVNKIAKYLGVETLPVDSVVEHPIDPPLDEALDEALDKVVKTTPTPPPLDDPQPDPLPPLDNPEA